MFIEKSSLVEWITGKDLLRKGIAEIEKTITEPQGDPSPILPIQEVKQPLEEASQEQTPTEESQPSELQIDNDSFISTTEPVALLDNCLRILKYFLTTTITEYKLEEEPETPQGKEQTACTHGHLDPICLFSCS